MFAAPGGLQQSLSKLCGLNRLIDCETAQRPLPAPALLTVKPLPYRLLPAAWSASPTLSALNDATRALEAQVRLLGCAGLCM